MGASLEPDQAKCELSRCASVHVKERLAVGLDTRDRCREEVRQRRRCQHVGGRSALVRPSPHSSSAWLAKRTAAFRSCRLAIRPRPASAASSRTTSAWCRGSWCAVGSSSSTSRVSCASAVAIATRWRSPRDRCRTSRSARAPQSSRCSHCAPWPRPRPHRERRSGPSIRYRAPCSRTGRSSDRSAAHARAPVRLHPACAPCARRARSRRRRPRRAPAIAASSVDLPAPLGPSTAHRSPSRNVDAERIDQHALQRSAASRRAGSAKRPQRSSTPQEPQKHRHADQRRQHTDRQLQRCKCAAGNGVGHTTSAPPSSIDAGSTTRWSLPTNQRTRCGATKPTNPTAPASVTALAVATAAISTSRRRVAATRTPCV